MTPPTADTRPAEEVATEFLANFYRVSRGYIEQVKPEHRDALAALIRRERVSSPAAVGMGRDEAPRFTFKQRDILKQHAQALRDLGEPNNIEDAKAMECAVAYIDYHKRRTVEARERVSSPAAVGMGRDEALEEAAKLCDEVAARYQLISRSVRANASEDCATKLAEAIRAMKSSPAASSRQEARGGWRPMHSVPMDGTHVLLFTTCHGIVEGWFDRGSWSEETPDHPREYSGDVWVCADDAFQIEAEICGPGPEWHHGTIKAWQPVLPPPPAAQEPST